MIDTHAHLDACADAARRHLARAREAGVDRVVAVGTGIDSCRAALAIAGRDDGVACALGIHPHQAAEETAGARRARASSSRTDRAVAVGETGLDFYRDYAPHDAQHRLSRRSSRSPPSSACRSSCTRAPPTTRRLDAARGFDGDGRPPLLLVARAARRRARARLLRLLRRQRHLPEGGRIARRGARVPADGSSPRPTVRTSRPSRMRGRPNEPAYVVHTVTALAAAARRDRRDSRRPDRRERESRLRLAVTTGPRQRQARARPALPRRREHPRRHRPARRATPRRCRARNRPRARRPDALPRRPRREGHAVEIDRSLEPRLSERLTGADEHRRRLRRRAGARPRRARSAAGSSWPTFPTTSPRRSSSRVWTGSRASNAGA